MSEVVVLYMAKKSCFGLLKRFFIAKTHSKPEKEKRRRWGLVRMKKKRLASISAPAPVSLSLSLSSESPLSKAEEEEEQRKRKSRASMLQLLWLLKLLLQLHRLPLRLFGSLKLKNFQFQALTVKPMHLNQFNNVRVGFQILLPPKFKLPFGVIFARKALRALKGLVRLQAIIRGRAVRRQAIATLKCLQSMVSFQSQVSAKKLQMVEGTWNTFHENSVAGLIQTVREGGTIAYCQKMKQWHVLKQERGCHQKRKDKRILVESARKQKNSEVHGIITQQDTVFPSNARIREQHGGQFKPRNSQKQYYKEELDPPISAPKRSFVHKKQLSVGDDNDFASSPIVPTYMAATESAKAKARSMSSPRLRGVNLDACSDTNSPYKHKLPPISSVNLGGF
ncbi:unnamed protein product [Camellia sinensis]